MIREMCLDLTLGIYALSPIKRLKSKSILRTTKNNKRNKIHYIRFIMKRGKLFCFILSLALILLFTGCSQPKTNTEISAFSYSEDSEIYKDDSPGVKHSGFVNTNESEIASAEDALERAKKECTIDWDTSHVAFDQE